MSKLYIPILLLLSIAFFFSCKTKEDVIDTDYSVTKKTAKIKGYGYSKGFRQLDMIKAENRGRAIMGYQVSGSDFTYNTANGDFTLTNDSQISGSRVSKREQMDEGLLVHLEAETEIEVAEGSGVIAINVSAKFKDPQKIINNLFKEALSQILKSNYKNYKKLSGKIYISGLKVTSKNDGFTATADISIVFLDGEL